MPVTRSPYAIALMVILALSVTPAEAQGDWVQFTHPTRGFSISYPPAWVPQIGNKPHLDLALFGPSAARAPAFEMAVFVISVPTLPTVTADDLVSDVFGDAVNPLREHVADYRLMRVDHTKLNGTPAVVGYATAQKGADPVYVMILVVATNSRGYAVAGITALDSTQLAAETRQLQAILASFRPGTGTLTGLVPH